MALVIDEAHLLIDKDNPEPMKFLYRIVKRIRKYNGVAIIITQNITDFTSEPSLIREANGIIANIQYQFIFTLKSSDINALDTLMKSIGGLTEAEKQFLGHSHTGTCLGFLTHSKRQIINIDVSDEEMQLIEGSQ